MLRYSLFHWKFQWKGWHHAMSFNTGYLFTISPNSSFHMPSLILTPGGTLYCWRYSSRNCIWCKQESIFAIVTRFRGFSHRYHYYIWGESPHLIGPDVKSFEERDKLLRRKLRELDMCLNYNLKWSKWTVVHMKFSHSQSWGCQPVTFIHSHL